MIIDSHIHLSHFLYNNYFPYLICDKNGYVQKSDGIRETLIDEMKMSGIGYVIEPGIDLESNNRSLELSKKHQGFHFSAVGVHPTRSYQYSTVDEQYQKITKRLYLRDFKKIEKWANESYVVAIGETGLDYHLERRNQHRLTQKVWFMRQLILADKIKKPVVLHIREADHDALKILRVFKNRLHGGVCHCFCGNEVLAKSYTTLGLMLGIGASILQDNCKDLEAAVRQTPLEYILLETDGPYVKPPCPCLSEKQHRNIRNTSLILPAVVKRIAELKGVSPEEVEYVTTENAIHLFHIT